MSSDALCVCAFWLFKLYDRSDELHRSLTVSNDSMCGSKDNFIIPKDSMCGSKNNLYGGDNNLCAGKDNFCGSKITFAEVRTVEMGVVLACTSVASIWLEILLKGAYPKSEF